MDEKKYSDIKKVKKEKQILEVDECGVETIVLDVKEEKKSIFRKKNIPVSDHSSSFNSPCTSSSADRAPIYASPSINTCLQLPVELEQAKKEIHKEKPKVQTKITITKIPNKCSTNENSPSDKRVTIENSVNICSPEISRQDLKNPNNENKSMSKQKRTRKWKNYNEEHDVYDDDDEITQTLTEDDSS